MSDKDPSGAGREGSTVPRTTDMDEKRSFSTQPLASSPATAKETPPLSAPHPAATADATSPFVHKSLWSRLIDLLPSWLSKAIYDKRQWKNFIRTLVALFVMCVLMVCQTSLDALGSATFFGLIAVCMLTPSMPLCIYIFAFITMVLGMLAGWAWGVAAFAAGLSVRSQSRLQAQMAGVQAGMDPNIPAKAQIAKALFEGKFLDPRASIVTCFFVFIGTYALGWLRAKKPKLALTAIFGTIILDLMTTFGPLFPQANYLIAKTLIVPATAAMAVGMTCTILLFPQTLNHLVLGGLIKGGLGPISGLLNMQDTVLTMDPDDHAAWGVQAAKASALRKGFASAASSLEASSKLLQLEISHGRISAGQLSELIHKTRDLGARAFGLGSFVMMIQERHAALERYDNNPLPHHTKRAKNVAQESLKAERESGRSIKDLLPELESSTSDLRKAAQAALNAATTYLTVINDRRWKKTPADFPTMEDREAQRQYLIKTLAEYRSSKHFNILSRYEDMFDANGNLIVASEKDLSASVRGLFRCFIFTSALISFSQKLVDYLDFIRLLEAENPKNKLQFPGKFVQAVVENANDSEFEYQMNDPLADNESQEARDDALNEDDMRTFTAEENMKRKKMRTRNPDAREPTNAFQRFGRGVSRAMVALTGPNGLYAVRYAFVSVALWIPAICPSTAKFYYDNRGLWALIMAQTGLGVVAGEQIFNVVSRVAGTCIGVIAGMVIWYIGAQLGSGNPYGIVAATVVFTAPFLFCRIAAPPIHMGFWILTSVTIVFTVGYSWVDMNIEQTANQGAGASLAGRRALLVIIGFAAGTLIAMLPKPLSAKTLVREGISKNIAAIGDLYGLEVTAFERSRNDPTVNTEERRLRYRDRFLKIFSRFPVIDDHIVYASMEPAFQGHWPKESYQELVAIQTSILTASATLSGAYSQINQQWIQRLTDRADLMHPNFVADCFSLFTLLRHSLRYKVPLPPTIPIFERLIHYRHSKRTNYVASRAASKLHLTAMSGARDASRTDLAVPRQPSPSPSPVPSRPDTPADSDAASSYDEDRIMITADKAMWDTLRGVLSWQACHDEQFAIFATAIISLTHIISGLNTMHSVVLDLVGERDLEGFDMAHDRWAAMEKA